MNYRITSAICSIAAVFSFSAAISSVTAFAEEPESAYIANLTSEENASILIPSDIIGLIDELGPDVSPHISSENGDYLDFNADGVMDIESMTDIDDSGNPCCTLTRLPSGADLLTQDYTYDLSELVSPYSQVTFKLVLAEEESEPSVPSYLSASDRKKKSLDVSYIKAKIRDQYKKPMANQTVYFSLNGSTYPAITDSEGFAAIEIPLLPAGTYTCFVACEGLNKNILVTVSQIACSMSVPQFTTTYNSGKYYKVTICDQTGRTIKAKTVKMRINKRVYSALTNANGIAAFKKLSTLTPKTYNAYVYCSGMKSPAQIIIRKASAKITMKKKSFKSRVVNKYYGVYLKTSKGKALKNTKVTLRVNGKNYTAKTNSKGKATFTLTRLTKKGTFTVKAKFAGNKKYSPVTKTSKITIK